MNVLYICQNIIGNIITSLPSVHSLKKKCEDISWDICVSKSYADIFSDEYSYLIRRIHSKKTIVIRFADVVHVYELSDSETMVSIG